MVFRTIEANPSSADPTSTSTPDSGRIGSVPNHVVALTLRGPRSILPSGREIATGIRDDGNESSAVLLARSVGTAAAIGSSARLSSPTVTIALRISRIPWLPGSAPAKGSIDVPRGKSFSACVLQDGAAASGGVLPFHGNLVPSTVQLSPPI